MEELKRIVAQIRTLWPNTRIIIRGDSGFCREAIMAWCEANRVEYVLGLAKNERLNTLSLQARCAAWDSRTPSWPRPSVAPFAPACSSSVPKCA